MEIMPAGTSAIVTGLSDSKSREFFYTECGKLFKSK